MKNDRQSMILEIISQENIETQEQLLVRLQERGITSTQATISRDIKQMHLIKEPVGHGVYKYAVSGNRTRLNFAEKLRTIFRESITSIDSAQNIVVIKTMPGLANGAAAALDTIKDAINYVSNVRGTLGATQNRLDHTINNLSVMQENIQDAESTIRDTDVADEMMAYTKNNILVQSAQAMLAQANQVPQGVLQLLQ